MNKPVTVSREKMQELLAKLRKTSPLPAIRHVETAPTPQEEAAVTEELTEINLDLPGSHTGDIVETDRNGNVIVYNAKQQRAVDIGGSGESLVIIGAAGTGKTTCQKGLVNKLIQSGKAGVLDAPTHKHLVSGTPGIIICAFTRRAVQNIRRNMPEDLKKNCITIHKLLEYGPVYDEYMDSEGNWKTKMSFQPARNAENPLPASIHTLIIEEASMLGLDLHAQLKAALPHNVQFIYLGDIQQLPPVFGPAILGFKLLELPVVELTEVYRQALESPIIKLAHRILSGKAIPGSEYPEWKVHDKLTLHPWKKKLKDELAVQVMGTFLTQAIDNNIYNPDEDIVLCPFNKSFGTDELNRKIANHLARKRGATTYEIRAGYSNLYFSPGDKVLFDKEDATIISIDPNPGYAGKPTQLHSTTLDYWGCNGGGNVKFNDELDVDDLLSAVVAPEANEEGERKRQSSHLIKIMMDDSEFVRTIQTVGDVNLLSLGYALTVHKSQGSEWRKVFFLLHQSHATMVQRELLYTGVTRAREELYIICEPETFTNGIRSQRVKGDTLEEKAEYFKGKALELGGKK